MQLPRINTHWFRQNSLLVIFHGAFLVVLGFVAWRLWGEYDTYQQTLSGLTEKLAQLEQLQNTDPTLSSENKDLLATNQTRLTGAYKQLQASLGRQAFTGKAMTNNIEFAQFLRRTVNEIERDTTTAQVLVPKDFKFGFKRYAVAVPKKNVSPLVLERLGKQVVIIKRLTLMMIQSKVEEIEAIRRVEIEPLPHGTTAADDVLTDSITIHPQEHYLAMPFELQFVCPAPALQALLNKLASSSLFLTVRVVSIEQESTQKRTDAADASMTPLSSEIKTPVAAATDRPPRLRVKVRLNYIEVMPPKSDERPTR